MIDRCKGTLEGQRYLSYRKRVRFNSEAKSRSVTSQERVVDDAAPFQAAGAASVEACLL